MPIPILLTLVLSVATGSWRTQVRTYRAEVHEVGESDGPEIHRAENVAAIELGGAGIRHLGERMQDRTEN